mgnify:CR=1 FL=1
MIKEDALTKLWPFLLFHLLQLRFLFFSLILFLHVSTILNSCNYDPSIPIIAAGVIVDGICVDVRSV